MPHWADGRPLARGPETAFEEAWEFALLGSSGTLPQPDRGPPMLRTRYISTALAMVVDHWMGHAVPISRLYRACCPMSPALEASSRNAWAAATSWISTSSANSWRATA